MENLRPMSSELKYLDDYINSYLKRNNLYSNNTIVERAKHKCSMLFLLQMFSLYNYGRLAFEDKMFVASEDMGIIIPTIFYPEIRSSNKRHYQSLVEGMDFILENFLHIPQSQISSALYNYPIISKLQQDFFSKHNKIFAPVLMETRELQILKLFVHLNFDEFNINEVITKWKRREPYYTI